MKHFSSSFSMPCTCRQFTKVDASCIADIKGENLGNDNSFRRHKNYT